MAALRETAERFLVEELARARRVLQEPCHRVSYEQVIDKLTGLRCYYVRLRYGGPLRPLEYMVALDHTGLPKYVDRPWSRFSIEDFVRVAWRRFRKRGWTADGRKFYFNYPVVGPEDYQYEITPTSYGTWGFDSE